MPELRSQLDFLRKYSAIDYDTLDIIVAKELGPFVDCTSNQAIAYFEIIKPENCDIIKRAAEFAYGYDPDEDKCVAYAVKASMVLLSLRILPYLTGRVHTQSTMYAAHDIEATVKDALEIVDIYKRISPGIDVDRICIKIPSTYEGLEACRILEAQGIRTLATTLFTLEQAILAHEVGCQYVSPYVNELKVHFVPDAMDTNKGFPVVKAIFEYYEKLGSKTRVLPASLVSSEEAMCLSGAHHITISPALLKELSQNTVSPDTPPSLVAETAKKADIQERSFIGKEKLFKQTIEDNPEASRKLQEAIHWFMKFENDMEAIMRKALKEGQGGI